MTKRRFEFFVEHANPSRTLLVDGTAEGFRSLSHWPGNSTPVELKRDLSTGITLAWGQLSDAEQHSLIGEFEVVANNHFDTDGVLSVFAVLHPEVAQQHSSLLLDAAATGDFAVWRGHAALAIDLTIMASSTSPDSPVPGLAAARSDIERWSLAYAYWMHGLPALLKNPLQHETLIAAQRESVLAQLEVARNESVVRVQRFPDEDLAVVSTRAELGPHALHEAVGDLHRVLVVHPGSDGPRYRFEYRDESWFELVDKQPLPLPRVPLDDLCNALNVAERDAGRATHANWWCEDLMRPVARLGFGRNERADGFFLDLGANFASDTPSRLPIEHVVHLLRSALAPR